MSNEKPEALEVADLFDNWSTIYGSGSRSRGATELRRQHARIQELEAILATQALVIRSSILNSLRKTVI